MLRIVVEDYQKEKVEVLKERNKERKRIRKMVEKQQDRTEIQNA